MADRITSRSTFIRKLTDGENLRSFSLIALVAANILPIYGVIVFAWDAFNIVLLYWAENLVIGFYNVVKIATIKVSNPIEYLAKLFSIPFFVIHFGGFCAIHGIFIFLLFGKSESPSYNSMGHSWPCFLVFVQLLIGVIKHCWATITPEMKYAIEALFASHGISYVHNYLIRGEYAVAGAKQLMETPYSQVMVMHFAIIAGAFLSAMIGSPAGILVILIVMKTIIDVKFHIRRHKTTLNARLHDNEKFILSLQ
jgi:hypothetical protein